MLLQVEAQILEEVADENLVEAAVPNTVVADRLYSSWLSLSHVVSTRENAAEQMTREYFTILSR